MSLVDVTLHDAAWLGGFGGAGAVLGWLAKVVSGDRAGDSESQTFFSPSSVYSVPVKGVGPPAWRFDLAAIGIDCPIWIVSLVFLLGFIYGWCCFACCIGGGREELNVGSYVVVESLGPGRPPRRDIRRRSGLGA